MAAVSIGESIHDNMHFLLEIITVVAEFMFSDISLAALFLYNQIYTWTVFFFYCL